MSADRVRKASTSASEEVDPDKRKQLLYSISSGTLHSAYPIEYVSWPVHGIAFKKLAELYLVASALTYHACLRGTNKHAWQTILEIGMYLYGRG